VRRELIPAFFAESITLPQIGQSGPSSIFATSNERSSAKQAVKKLDQELKNENGRSPYLNTTLKELQHLLDGDELTEL
jgi:hypothetical protein